MIANDGRPVSKPTAAVTLARSAKGAPIERATATLEPIGVPGVSELPQGIPSIYVVHLHVPAPGTYWVRARPAGARIQGIGNVAVATTSYSPAVGAKAIPSDTPTLANSTLAQLTTATKPYRPLYTTSVRQALAAHLPFVVTFATPKFCTSRTCGPVVDVVTYVAKGVSPKLMRFIHVEVYEDNDPAKGYNRWMKQWHLQSEPWVFVVGRDGRIRAKFEGSVSSAELTAAVHAALR